ncbi:hypothetical protein OSTOST_20810, partial [Ostertagia ostertagi]
MTAIYGILFSVCHILLVPVISINDYFIIFVALGPLRKPPFGQLLLLVFCVAYIGSLVIVTNSFVYRYLQLCRSGTFQSYSKARGLLIVILFNAAVIFNWIVIVKVALWPTTLLFEYIKQVFH